ncbi:hypothetical protein Tco_0993514 [Tanacetum coccineum]
MIRVLCYMSAKGNVTRELSLVKMSRGMTRWLQTNTQGMDFYTKTKPKEAQQLLTHGLPRWQSVLSYFDLTDKIGQLMIGSKEGTGSFGASNRLEDLESSFSYYKYKHPLTHKEHLGVDPTSLSLDKLELVDSSFELNLSLV